MTSSGNTNAVTKVDKTIRIDEPFCLMDIRKKFPYSDLQSESLIHDLQRCFLVIDSTPEVFVIKDYDGIEKTVKLSYINESGAKTKMKKIFVGFAGVTKPKKIDAWDIYLDNTIRFTKKGLSFYDTDPTMFSYFRGYDINRLKEVDINTIQMFLNHIHDVICDGNEEIYRYILVWIASILQQPSFKTGTALVILGKQGCGKNTFFTDIICKLMAIYANKNVTSIEDIVGKFNALLENKKLLILNELQSIDVNKFLNSDALKSVITDNTININQKNEPVRIAQNVANFVLVSNNSVPIKIESFDRRYVVTHASDKHMGDYDYFGGLAETFTPEFYENLFTFFMMYDTSNFNLRKLPNTDAKQIIKEASMSSYELFVREKYKEIVELSGPDLYQMYVDFATLNHHAICSSRTFIANIQSFTGKAHAKRIKKLDGKLVKVYSVSQEYINKFQSEEDELQKLIIPESEEYEDLDEESIF